MKQLALYLGCVLLCASLQAMLPTAWWAGGLRLELVPSLVAFGALTFRTPRARVGFAVVAGLAQDAFSAATPYGISALAYGLAAFGLTRWERWLDRDLPWIQSGAAVFVSVTAGLLAILARGWISAGSVPKLFLLGLISGLVAPLLFTGMNYLGQTFERRLA